MRRCSHLSRTISALKTTNRSSVILRRSWPNWKSKNWREGCSMMGVTKTVVLASPERTTSQMTIWIEKKILTKMDKTRIMKTKRMRMMTTCFTLSVSNRRWMIRRKWPRVCLVIRMVFLRFTKRVVKAVWTKRQQNSNRLTSKRGRTPNSRAL